jgi:hypothetical protein
MITCYAQYEKEKSLQVVSAFATGVHGTVKSASSPRLGPGAAAFYGVRPAYSHLWYEAIAKGRDWYYIDNSWFDVTRERYFRIGVNALQTVIPVDCLPTRLEQQQVRIRREKNNGSRILVCRQSDEYMRLLADWPDGAIGWQRDVLLKLKKHTDRMIEVRQKGSGTPLASLLWDCSLLITHSSATAVQALLFGVPVIVTDPKCAAAPLATTFEKADNPYIEGDVHAWAARLACSQWSYDELRCGTFRAALGI